ncbi:hypothetical protein D5086_002423 [Populus alba]|uniref:Uncharacterized protein n=1 Tax=Populus alba TaxID=43335 RepID=A0ACC4D2R1_POPAL
MDKGAPSGLFVNDGSFMEKFKQLQQGNGKEQEKDKGAAEKDSKPKTIVSGSVTPKPSFGKVTMQLKANDGRKTPPTASGGKLAFSLKQKSKLMAPAVKLGEDEEDEDEVDGVNASGDVSAKRQKLGQLDTSEQSSRRLDVAPPPPSDPTVKNVADKLASFVAKHGRQFENVTRQKNPGDTPFKFLFDENCADFKYYEYRLTEEEKALSQSRDSQISSSGGTSTSASKSTGSYQSLQQQHSNYQIPASALYDDAEEPKGSMSTSSGRAGESSAPAGTDPIAMMEFYVKKAAHEERRRQPRHSKDEMPPPASLQAISKKGHHMGDYIPPVELEKFLSTCNDAASRKAAKEAAERAKIQADNVGHKLLSKMGWKEGEGLGSSRNGISNPIMAGDVKKDHLGVGAHNPGEVTPDDDIYEQYKKRMMLVSASGGYLQLEAGWLGAKHAPTEGRGKKAVTLAKTQEKLRIYGIGGIQGSSEEDMSLLYSPSFNYSDGELRKSQEFMDLNPYHFHQQQQQQIQQISALKSYRSAPSSFLESLVNGTSDHSGGNGGVGSEDYCYLRSSSPEMDTMLKRPMTSCNGSGDFSSQNLQEFEERPAIRQEQEDSEMVYRSLPGNNLVKGNSVSVGNSLDSAFSVMDSMDLENAKQATKMSTRNGSNLARQNSSPAGILSNHGVDNGFAVMRNAGSFRAGNGTNGEATPSTSRLRSHVNFSSGHRTLPQITEIGEECVGGSSPEGGFSKRKYMYNFNSDTWGDASRLKDNDGNMFSGLNTRESQVGNSGNHMTGLTHHLSLPKTVAEMATAEKFLDFQGNFVPCKIRAKRGFATHPRSIAERVRRTRISERMRKLQELFPDMDKQTSTADKLDLSIELIKDLQKQVKIALGK